MSGNRRCVFEVPTEQCLRELRELALAPISLRISDKLLGSDSDPDAFCLLALASYRWSASEMLRYAKRFRELLSNYVHVAPLASADLGASMREVRDVHIAAGSLGQAMTDSVAVIGGAFQELDHLAPGPTSRFCTELGPTLTAEWALMTALLSRLSIGCGALVSYLEFITAHAADIEITSGRYFSLSAPVERGLHLGQRRMTALLMEHDALLGKIDAIDSARRCA